MHFRCITDLVAMMAIALRIVGTPTEGQQWTICEEKEKMNAAWLRTGEVCGGGVR